MNFGNLNRIDCKINDITAIKERTGQTNVSPRRLTFHQRGWHRGWHGCCPCPPGSALARRTSVVCFEWRTAVSPGWCPGGPGSPRTGRWCDRLPADSSLDPCSPWGHLTRSKKRRGCQATLCKIDSLRRYSFCLKAWADPRCTWFILKHSSTPHKRCSWLFLFLIWMK